MLLLAPSPNNTDGKMEGVGRRVGGGGGGRVRLGGEICKVAFQQL